MLAYCGNTSTTFLGGATSEDIGVALRYGGLLERRKRRRLSREGKAGRTREVQTLSRE
jgi:hypothetical protein